MTHFIVSEEGTILLDLDLEKNESIWSEEDW
jgi:hypothetical protein